jgi:hypothetical protein
MTQVDLRYVKPERDRQGRIAFWYFRRHGRRWRLPGEPLSEEFMSEYYRLRAATDPKPVIKSEPAPGSFGSLVKDYFASRDEFLEKRPNTQRVYRLILESLVEKYGTAPVYKLQRRHLVRWRNARSDTPGMANLLVKVVRTVLKFGADNNYRLASEDNPLAVRIKMFKLGAHRAWTEGESAAFEVRWAPGTMERRCYVLAKCTGQRAGDLAAMTRNHRRDGFIHVVQEKTGKELDIPELQELTAELALGEQGHLSLLTGPDGSSFDGGSLGKWFADAIDAAGLPDDCVLHGLRKLTAKTFAEAGCSPHLIGAITGHDPTSHEITRYTRQADQRKMAKAAILQLERNGKRTKAGKQSSRQTGKRWPTF